MGRQNSLYNQHAGREHPASDKELPRPEPPDLVDYAGDGDDDGDGEGAFGE